MAKLIETGSLLETDIQHMTEVNLKLAPSINFYSNKGFKLFLVCFLLGIITAITFGCLIIDFFILKKLHFSSLHLLYIALIYFLISLINSIHKYNQEYYSLPHKILREKSYNKNDIEIKKVGLEGEMKTLELLKTLDDSYSIIYGYPVIDESRNDFLNNCEMDFVVIGPNGAFVVENKYVQGEISGKSTDMLLLKEREDNYGNLCSDDYKNPIRQVNRQLQIFKNFLKENNMDMYLKPIIYFGHENCSINIENTSHVEILSAQDNLVEFIKNYEGRPLSQDQIHRFFTFTKEHITQIRETELEKHKLELNYLLDIV